VTNDESLKRDKWTLHSSVLCK